MKEKGSIIVRGNVGAEKTIIKAVPDPEVTEKAARRKFTAEYKLSIVREADTCTERGQIGALLRREGIYSSNLTLWRRQIRVGLVPGGREPVARKADANVRHVAGLEKDNAWLVLKLKQVELIIAARKEVAALLRVLEKEEENS